LKMAINVVRGIKNKVCVQFIETHQQAMGWRHLAAKNTGSLPIAWRYSNIS